MVEKPEEAGTSYRPPHDDDTSGVRENPWAAHLRAMEGRGDDPHAHLAALVAQVGAPVLGRFPRLDRDERAAVVAAAIDRVATRPEGALSTAHLAHAVLCEAIPAALRLWIAHTKADPAEVAHDLAFARRRLCALSGRERVMFAAVCALDDTAGEDEVSQVVLRAAVAFQMRWNTAHQNVSRAWRKICAGTSLYEQCEDWREGHRFVCGPPSFRQWETGRAYMDACSGRGGHGGEAFGAWVEAHESHNGWFNEWKKQSSRATRRWKELAAALDASAVTPARLQGPLIQSCVALGIDRWVFPIKLAQQSWQDLLDHAQRPSGQAREAWLPFLRAHGLEEVEPSLRALQHDATLADVASVELVEAYRRLLSAAEQQSPEGLRARDAFRTLVEDGGLGLALPTPKPAAGGDPSGEPR
jgi:hypothetical protein